jgi:hypothetical protein
MIDPLLIGVNFIVFALGCLTIAVARSQSSTRRGAIALYALSAMMIVSAVLALPSRALKMMKGFDERNEELSEGEMEYGDDCAQDNDFASSPDDDSSSKSADSSRGSSSVLLYGSCPALELLLEQAAATIRSRDDSAITSVPTVGAEEDPTPAPAPIAPEPTTSPLPTRDPFSAPAVITPERERTLPEEPTSGEPACTGFTLLHGPSGGPGQGGCYAVGCKEGYALPMALTDRWKSCDSPKRLERMGDCYYFYDADGSERSVRFANDAWAKCD